ncbi:MAG: hypothetical protein RL682_717, partial [Pseudomonadota bacterium]
MIKQSTPIWISRSVLWATVALMVGLGGCASSGKSRAPVEDRTAPVSHSPGNTMPAVAAAPVTPVKPPPGIENA